ncbi:MAG: UTP--glucose-1-phosphate uridylyltransferase, partial [Treponema sp.]|nr:UTP--glucose-1-phosphate uridylyltransferase [Treponema sp.]
MAQVHEPRQDLSFNDVWAALMELRESQKETDRLFRESKRETDRLFRESQEKTDRLFQESQKETAEQMKETAEQMKETDRKISRLGSRLGDLIEHLTASNILDEFKKQGYEFTRISRNNKIKDEKNRILAEIDILLENGDFAMVVEVKSLLTTSDVKDHIKRMETLRRYADLHGDGRKYVSSVSGALIEEAARDFALRSGIYVIEHPGERIRIKAPET